MANLAATTPGILRRIEEPNIICTVSRLRTRTPSSLKLKGNRSQPGGLASFQYLAGDYEPQSYPPKATMALFKPEARKLLVGPWAALHGFNKKNTSSHAVIQLASHVPPQEEHRHKKIVWIPPIFCEKKHIPFHDIPVRPIGISSIGDVHHVGTKCQTAVYSLQYRYNHVQSLNQLKPPSPNEMWFTWAPQLSKVSDHDQETQIVIESAHLEGFWREKNREANETLGWCVNGSWNHVWFFLGTRIFLGP